MEISVDVAGFIQDIGATPERIDDAIETSLDRVAQIGLQAKNRQISKTYARSIPRRKNGKAKWKRSGDFAGGQRIESRKGERVIVTTGNAVKHEERLANLPVSSDGVARANPAAQNAADIIEPQRLPIFEAEILNALR